jgi:hypothetical protein
MPLSVLSEGGSYRGARSCRTQHRRHSSLSAAGTAQVLRLEQGGQNGGTRATTYFGGGQDRALLGTHYPRVRLRRAADTARPRRGLALGAAHGIRLLVWERPHDIDQSAQRRCPYVQAADTRCSRDPSRLKRTIDLATGTCSVMLNGQFRVTRICSRTLLPYLTALLRSPFVRRGWR